jgi:hypothetical protein
MYDALVLHRRISKDLTELWSRTRLLGSRNVLVPVRVVLGPVDMHAGTCLEGVIFRYCRSPLLI